jgi:hypothetical protein
MDSAVRWIVTGIALGKNNPRRGWPSWSMAVFRLERGAAYDIGSVSGFGVFSNRIGTNLDDSEDGRVIAKC